jgi:hypothetical protein
MPRDGSQVYHIPLGTEGAPDTTIESAKYNTFAHDVEQDLNAPRPVVAGGTGASSAAGALASLGAEEALQLVDNYDSFPFVAGSFYSGAGATNEPIDGHSFIGICYQSDNNNIAIEARDMTDAKHTVYARVKVAGVWAAWAIGSVADFVLKAGDTMTGPLTLSGDPTALLHAVPKQYVDARIAVIPSATPPPIAVPGTMWWETDTGLLYMRYDDGDSVQWVIACPQPDFNSFMYMGPPYGAGTAGTITPDFAIGLDVTWTISSGVSVLNNPINIKPGQRGTFYLIQDSGGSKTITTWGSKYKFPGGVKPVLSTAGGAIDTFTYSCDGANLYCVFSKGFA